MKCLVDHVVDCPIDAEMVRFEDYYGVILFSYFSVKYGLAHY